MTEELKNKFEDYASYHTSRMNRITHYIGIPLIAFSLVGLFAQVQLGFMDLGWVLCGIAFVFYYSADKNLALLFFPILLIFYYFSHGLPLNVLIAMQAAGWVSQYIGHLAFEKKSPAFYKNIEHLLVGPVWIFSKLIRYK
jgi:uncharacterized membrane protein YGL010W